MNDVIQRFMFEHTATRGAWIRLSKSVSDALEHHDYPDMVNQLLAKAMACSCLLVSSIKLAGKVIFQLQTDGKAPLILAQSNEQYHIRALARLDNDSPEDTPLLGKGHLAITLAPDLSDEKFQGLVTFDDDSMNTALERYFDQSEQIPTKLYLASTKTETVGLLLQRMPGNQYQDVEIFEELTILANTLSDEELLSWDLETLLAKVFHEHDIRLLPSESIQFKCSCSEEKIEGILINLGKEELLDILKDHPYVEIHCDFCNKQFLYRKNQIDKLFDNT